MPLSSDTAADLEWALDAFRMRRTEQILYTNYMAGQQRLGFVTAQYARAFRELLFGLRLNICPAVIHVMTDRLKVVGFHGDTQGKEDPIGSAAWQLWQDSRCDRHANQIHSEALVSGDAYLVVWPDDGEGVCFYPQRGMDMIVKYDPERPGVMLYAVKMWSEGQYYRVNVYYPDRIEKYRTAEGAKIAASYTVDQLSPGLARLFGQIAVPAGSSMFNPYQPDTDTTWPVLNKWQRVPVFHFPNDAGLGRWGVSELRDVIPLQDAINKELADLVVASEFGAFRQRYAIGVDTLDYDDEGQPIQTDMKSGVDRLLTVANADAKFGEFSETPLNNFLSTITELVSHVARIKGIPLHEILMTGTFPSGESQKTAESRLVSKIQDIQIDFGDVWEDALSFGLLIDQGTADAQLTVDWAPVASRSELEHVQAVGLKVLQAGISQEQAWRELDYSEDDIKRMQLEKQVSGQTVQAAMQSQQLTPGQVPGKAG